MLSHPDRIKKEFFMWIRCALVVYVTVTLRWYSYLKHGWNVQPREKYILFFLAYRIRKSEIFANKTSHFVASWYRPPGSTSEEFQLFREQLDYIRTHHKGKKLPSAHVLGDFNFKDIDWPDRFSKSGSTLSQSEGQILIDIMNDHGLEQMVHFPTREKNTLDLILTTLPDQLQDVHSPDKLSDHDIVSGTLKIFIPPIKEPRRKVYLYQKGDYDSMRKDTLEFAKEKYFNGHSDTRSVQENFDLLTSFI